VPAQSGRRTTIGQGLLLLAALAYTGLLAAASLYPVGPDSALAATATRRTINNLLHVPAYSMLAVFWMAALRARGTSGMWIGAGAAFGFGVLMELVQNLVPGRSASAGDFVLNALGVLLGWAAVRLLAGREFAGRGAPPDEAVRE
jgi:VanZ family protein